NVILDYSFNDGSPGNGQGSGGTAIATGSTQVNITPLNDSPVLSKIGPSVATNEQTAALLDTDATVSDLDLDGTSGALGNYAGASLTIVRHGGANADDSFGFDTTGALFTVNGSSLQAGGLTFATFANTGGTLVIIYTSSQTDATTVLVNNVMDHVTYTNLSD